MSSIQKLVLVMKLFLGILPLCLSVPLLRAQAFNPVAPVCHGKFTLPFEVQWGHALLPPGEYSFQLQSKSLPAVVVVRGEHMNAAILAAGISPVDSSSASELIIGNQGGRHQVRAIRLGAIGVVVSYHFQKAEREEVAQASQAIERVPILQDRR